MLKRSCEVGRKIGCAVTNKSMIALTKIPGIRGILQSSKDAKEIKLARDNSLRYQRMKIIRANKSRSGVDKKMSDFIEYISHVDCDKSVNLNVNE